MIRGDHVQIQGTAGVGAPWSNVPTKEEKKKVKRDKKRKVDNTSVDNTSENRTPSPAIPVVPLIGQWVMSPAPPLI